MLELHLTDMIKLQGKQNWPLAAVKYCHSDSYEGYTGNLPYRFLRSEAGREICAGGVYENVDSTGAGVGDN